MIVLFGGTFDPIHCGHLYIANIVLKRLNPKKILFTPVRLPPHRLTPNAASHDRAAMIELAIKGESRFQLCNLELQRPTPSYTIDTVNTLKDLYPNDKIGMLVGEDAYKSINSWLHAENILKAITPIVISRHSTKLNNKTESAIYLETTCYPASSTIVRHLINNNQPLDSLLPKLVIEYIKQNKLYRY